MAQGNMLTVIVNGIEGFWARLKLSIRDALTFPGSTFRRT